MSPIRSHIASLLLILASSLATLLVANFLFAFLSMHLANQTIFPRALINSLDGCYQTFYPSTHDKTLQDWTGVVGDSYGAGEGDEFLGGAKDYGMVHKLRKLNQTNYLVFARGGFGSINAVREMVQCMAFMNDSLLFRRIEPPKKITVLFYEGNDLNDNLNHLAQRPQAGDMDSFIGSEIDTGFDFRRQLRLYFPLLKIVKDSTLTLAGGDPLTTSDLEAPPGQLAANNATANYVALSQGSFRVPLNPQSAAVELSDLDLERALQVFYGSVAALRQRFAAADIEIVYLPSPVTVYGWSNSVKIQTYQSRGDVSTTTEENLRRSTEIRQHIGEFAGRNGYRFVDPTLELRRLARENLLHGPRDWKHFNNLGYQAVARMVTSAVTPQGGHPAQSDAAALAALPDHSTGTR